MSFLDGAMFYFNAKQRNSIEYSTAYINIWEGAVRSGKTMAALMRWLIYIVRDAPAGNLLMSGNTRDTIYRNMIQPLEEFFPSLVKYKQGATVAYICNRPVFVIGAKDEGSEKRIRGITLSGALVDELTQIPKSFWKMLISRVSKRGGKIFATTNPDAPKHWLKVEYLDSPNRRKKKGWVKSWHFELRDNHTLDKEFIDNLSMSYSGLWYKRFILGLWVQASGAIYDMIDESRHFVPANQVPTEYDKFYVGVDYGPASVTCAILVGCIGDRLYILKEWYHDAREKGSLTTSKMAEEIRKFIGGIPITKILVDPSAAALKIEMAHLGMSCSEYDPEKIQNAINAVIPGIGVVANYFGQDRMFVSNACPITQKELMGYVWDEKFQAIGKDAPVKVDDHTCDCTRYVCSWITAPTTLSYNPVSATA